MTPNKPVKEDGLREIFHKCTVAYIYLEDSDKATVMNHDMLEQQIRSWAAGEMRKILYANNKIILASVFDYFLEKIDEWEKGDL